MSKLSRNQIIYLHTLITVNNLSDKEYRELLSTGAKVSSSKQLDQQGLDDVLDLMESIGLNVGERKRPVKPQKERRGMATSRQLRYLDDLAIKVYGKDGNTAFSHWLERYFKVSHTRFLTREAAQRAIEALKSMAERGYCVKEGK